MQDVTIRVHCVKSVWDLSIQFFIAACESTIIFLERSLKIRLCSYIYIILQLEFLTLYKIAM